MKIRFLKGYKRFLAYVLSIIGVGMSGCTKDNNGADPGGGVAMYGMPMTTYKVSGIVTNNSSSSIENIQVVLSEGQDYSWGDTAYTNSIGYYMTEYSTLGNDTLIVSFMDTSGVYQKLDTIISFVDINPTGADGSWDMGTKSKVLNVSLKKK